MYRSPLYNLHVELGASFTVFAGWEHPVDYGSVVEEHLTVRHEAGVFDLSHLGRLLLDGDTTELLEKLIPRRLAAKPGVIDGPTAFLNEKGGFIDDVLLYPLSDGKWLVVTNAANREKVTDWLLSWASRLGLRIKLEDVTFNVALVAVQGPSALDYLGKVGLDTGLLSSLKRMEFVENLETPFGRVWIVSRSGWTGEDGFELYGPPSTLAKLFKALVEKGVRPCGLGARDSLRMEMGFPLAGEELTPDVTPVEARYWLILDWGKVAKGECVGCESVWKRYREGVDVVRVGVKLAKGARAVPRSGDKVVVGDSEVGKVTSGAYSPVLGRGIGQAYISSRHALMGLEVTVLRGRRAVKAKICDFPFIRK